MTYPWPNKAVPARVIAVALTSHLCLIASHAAPPFPAPPHPDADARCTSGPQLQGRKLRSGADLFGLDLRGMMLYGTDHDYSGVNFSGANLSGAGLEGSDVLYTKFSNCTFRNAIMRKVDADWVIDRSCDMTDADITGSRIRLDPRQLRSTWNYKNKDLAYTWVWMSGSQAGFDFAGFNLRGTRLAAPHLGKGPLFVDADFTDADIREAFIRLTAEQLRSTKNYRAADLAKTTLVGGSPVSPFTASI